MNQAASVNRRYESDVRRARASETRTAIIEAATSLFVEHGYGPTSIDDVASAAGVSRATVFNSVGGKASLLRAAYDVAIVGDDEPVPLPERRWARPVREAPDAPTMLDRYAHMATVIAGRVAAIWEVMRGAASAHEEVRRDWEQIHDERRRGMGNVVTMLRAHRPLRRGVSSDAAADILLVFIDPAMYHQLVERQGWRPRAFESWLAYTLRTQLLGGS